MRDRQSSCNPHTRRAVVADSRAVIAGALLPICTQNRLYSGNHYRANYQPERTNTILGPDWRLLHGEQWAWARLGGVDVCFGPGSFMQVCCFGLPLSALACRKLSPQYCMSLSAS